jgi:hypothetical protein
MGGILMAKNNMSDKESARKEFLLHMYDQMFNDINRHMGVVWQPITVLFGSFALIGAATQEIISMDIAVALVVVLIGWLIAILYDSSYWYNRNLAIIANIERQFLRQSDKVKAPESRVNDGSYTHPMVSWSIYRRTSSAIPSFHRSAQQMANNMEF